VTPAGHKAPYYVVYQRREISDLLGRRDAGAPSPVPGADGGTSPAAGSGR
jgi:hypothetical protein